VPSSLDPTVHARLQACLDAADRPAVALGPEARIVAANRAATDAGRGPAATTFAELVTANTAEIAGPCAEVDAAARALDLDIPSRTRSVDGRERVRLVPFADGVVIAVSRFRSHMFELDPVILRSEIHEGLSQDLSALGFAACALRMRLDELEDEVLIELATRVESLAETASTTVRALYRHFERGATGGLLDALSAMASELEEAVGTQIWIRVEGESVGPAPHVRDQVAVLVRQAAIALAGTSSRAWLVLGCDTDRTRIELHARTPIDPFDADTRARLDALADPMGAVWSHDRASIWIVV
jgi:hypothetical protein